MNPTRTSILIVSYLKDKPYLHYCLRSIQKFAPARASGGFSEIVVVVPSVEAGDFSSMLASYSPAARMVTYERDPNPAKWHLHAQAQKHWADKYCPGADFVLHTDSDCVFTEPVGPEDYFVNGKPVMLYEDYLRIAGSPWREVTQRALRRPVNYEFMRRHPQVNPIGIYKPLREYINVQHGVPFEQHVLAQKPTFPWGWTEHNIIGAYAFYSPEWHGRYEWVEVGHDPVPREKLAQFWSLGPIDQEQPLPHAGGRGTPISEFKKLGL